MAELVAVGKPSVLIPLVPAAGDEQRTAPATSSMPERLAPCWNPTRPLSNSSPNSTNFSSTRPSGRA
ncbi:hypothetical protein AB0L30_01150 [Microbispora rosea]|uniref:hypothetical protein n=1 Tax=Microbispora rosea TaxID=58117 RepID=UPI003427BFF9